MIAVKEGYTPEGAVIGSLIADAPFCLDKIKSILRPEHFEDDRLSVIYGIALKLGEGGGNLDIVTILPLLDPSLKNLLINILEDFPGILNVEVYRDKVIQAFHERKLKKHLADGINFPDEQTIKAIETEWRGIQSLGARKFDLNGKIISYLEVLEKRGKGLETFYPTGFPTLDYKVPLLKRGEMCTIGARTSMGKTALLLAIMMKMAKAGLRVVFASGEMSFNQLMDRLIAIETEIFLMDIRKGELKKADWPKVTQMLSELAEMSIRFVEASKLSFDKVVPHVLDFKPDVLFVDYAQRFSPDGKVDSRASFFSDVANGLKGLAVERNIVVILACQLGRDVDKRKDEPRLSDLKESGGFEEASDVVWLLHAEKNQGIFGDFQDFKMMIAKNRNGPTFSFDAVFNPQRALFHEKEDI